MKKYLLPLILLTSCVPPGYVKDPNLAPVTKGEMVQFEKVVSDNMVKLYNSIEQQIKEMQGKKEVKEEPKKK